MLKLNVFTVRRTYGPPEGALRIEQVLSNVPTYANALACHHLRLFTK